MSTFVSVEGYSLRLDSKEAVDRFSQLLEDEKLDDFISDCFNQAVNEEQQVKSMDSVLVKLDEFCNAKPLVALEAPVALSCQNG